ncbi:hypothetical protein ARALYDRAFT_900266 [Arabidopsis lyrata subsp. lyrata]|uniref:CSD domain-containing protein n=1 Tax=Arabidopsis lyrata subsp. lyrata TaxID=81972 RepID=D7L124_ARALL|nr:hypothetical protein ARALYDRAFT_900266 [Arabidopsis lyrata subsp. lyrata]
MHYITKYFFFSTLLIVFVFLKAEHCADAEVIYKFLEVNEIDKTTVVSGDDLFVHQSISSEKFRSLAVDEAVEFKVEVDNASRLKTVEVSGPEGAPVQ